MSRLTGTNLVDKIVPFDSEDTYPTHEDFYGKGGYVTLNTTDNPVPAGSSTILQALTAGTMISFDQGAGRQKPGQIIYNAQDNRHYQIVTAGAILTGARLKQTFPYEYSGTFMSTNIVSKNAENIIENNVGAPSINREFYSNCGILAGEKNRILIDYNTNFYAYDTNPRSTTIVGGSGNRAYNTSSSLIGGGSLNRLFFGSFSNIVGGRNNFLNGTPYSIIGGGENNNIGGPTFGVGEHSIIVGGKQNRVIGKFNTLGGGENNLIRGTYNAILGGKDNTASGEGDIVVGGTNNKTFGVSQPGSVIYVKSYTELGVNRTYATDTKFSKFGNVYIESIPGATVNGLDAAGVVRLYKYSNTYNDNISSREVLQTITSPTPTASGRFGHWPFFLVSDSYTCNGMFLSEPGANKLHFYHFNTNNASHQVTRSQTIDLNVIDNTFPPVSSQFGYCLNFLEGNYSYLGTGGPTYNILVVGAPGADKAYVFKTNSLYPGNSAGFAANPFTLLDTLTGEVGSEFGTSVIAAGYWSTGNFLSAVYIAVGAPNQTTPYGKSGAVNYFYTPFSSSYTINNKQFVTPFTKFGNAQLITYVGGSPTQTWYNMKPGERFGESISLMGVSLKNNNFGVGVENLAFNTQTQLSSFYIGIYTNIAKKSYVYIYRPDPDDSSKIADNTATYSIPYNLSQSQINAGYKAITAIEAGTVEGVWVYLSGMPGSNEQFVESSYGSMGILGQFGNPPSIVVEGPGGNSSQIYDIESVLNSTNFKWNYPSVLYNAQVPTEIYYSVSAPSISPRKNNSKTNSLYPGTVVAATAKGEKGYTHILPPYPTSNYNQIEAYGFTNFKTAGNVTDPGYSTFYFLSAGVLSYCNATQDFPGEIISTSVMVGGKNNAIRGKDSAIISGESNSIEQNVARSFILAGAFNSIYDSTNIGSAKQGSVIVTGSGNKIDSSEYSVILNGQNNKINKSSSYSVILNGRDNTVIPGISGVYVLASSVSATQYDTTYVNNLFATDHIQAKTKSFTIAHPTKKGKTLTYGSLESPYHGIRLTGNDTVINGECIVRLPDYISNLVSVKNINIQLTNYQHSKQLYVDGIDISNNSFTVKVDCLFKRQFEYKFFWSFTAIRSDVPELATEA